MTTIEKVFDRVGGIRADFPMFAGPGPTPTFLDNAATTQKPRAVLDAITTYYTTANSNVGRGFYDLSMRATDAHEHARETVRRFLNAPSVQDVVFTRNTTESINLVAETHGRAVVGAGDNVVVTGLEHHSNLLPWKRLCEDRDAELRVLPASENGTVTAAGLRDLVDDRTRIVAVGHVSNVLGCINPVAEMVAVAHEVGATALVDGAQAVARMPVDVVALDADFYCFSSHKVYGPTGIGVLYGRSSLLAEMSPYQVGGGIVKGVTVAGPIEWRPLPARMEAGTPDVAGTVGLAAAIDYVEGLGFDWVAEHDSLLTRMLADVIADVGGTVVYGPPVERRAGAVSFAVEGLHPYDVGNHLNAHGIAVRTGVHCAEPLLDSMQIVGTIRASVGVYNTEDEITALGAALRTVEPGVWTKERADVRRL